MVALVLRATARHDGHEPRLADAESDVERRGGREMDEAGLKEDWLGAELACRRRRAPGASASPAVAVPSGMNSTGEELVGMQAAWQVLDADGRTTVGATPAACGWPPLLRPCVGLFLLPGNPSSVAEEGPSRAAWIGCPGSRHTNLAIRELRDSCSRCQAT